MNKYCRGKNRESYCVRNNNLKWGIENFTKNRESYCGSNNTLKWRIENFTHIQYCQTIANYRNSYLNYRNSKACDMICTDSKRKYKACIL